MSTTPKPAAAAAAAASAAAVPSSSSSANHGHSGHSGHHAQPPKKLAGAEFVYRPRFKNDLPPLPFDPKSLKLDLNHFADDLNVKYFLSSVEKTQPYHLPIPDLPIDLIQLGLFDADEYAFDPLQTADKTKLKDVVPTHMHDPLDAELFTNPDSVLSGAIKSNQHIKLRLPTGAVPAASDAIDGDFPSGGTQSQSQRSGAARSAAPNAAAANARWTSRMRRLTTKDADDQLAVIESTFESAAARLKAHTRHPISHPSKPGVTARRILPVVPSLRLFANAYAHVDLPAGSGFSAAARAARARSASPERDPLPRGAVLRTAEVPHHNLDAHALQMFAVHLPQQPTPAGQDALDMPVADPDVDPDAAQPREYAHAGTYTFTIKAKDSYTNPDTHLHLALRVPSASTYLPTMDGAPVVTTMATAGVTPAEYVPIKSRIEMKRARVMKPGATYADYESAVHAGGGIPVADPKGRTSVYLVPLGEASVGGKAMAYENGIGVGFEEAERLAAAGLRDWVEVPGGGGSLGSGGQGRGQREMVDMVQSLDDDEEEEDDAALLFGDDD